MNDKELSRKKKQAQLDEWKADVDKLRAKASGASADAQRELNRRTGALGGRIEEGRTELAELADASEDAWESLKDGVDSAWDSMRTAFSDAGTRFKR